MKRRSPHIFAGRLSEIREHSLLKLGSRKYAMKKKLTVMEFGLWSPFTNLRINFILCVNKEFERGGFYKSDIN